MEAMSLLQQLQIQSKHRWQQDAMSPLRKVLSETAKYDKIDWLIKVFLFHQLIFLLIIWSQAF